MNGVVQGKKVLLPVSIFRKVIHKEGSFVLRFSCDGSFVRFDFPFISPSNCVHIYISSSKIRFFDGFPDDEM